jgi:hypothetical protein
VVADFFYFLFIIQNSMNIITLEFLSSIRNELDNYLIADLSMMVTSFLPQCECGDLIGDEPMVPMIYKEGDNLCLRCCERESAQWRELELESFNERYMDDSDD